MPLVACDKGGLKGPEAEVKKTDIKLDLPGIPSFDLPPSPGEGQHSVKELRVRGRKLFGPDGNGSEITVHGYVTWVYDCLTGERPPEQSAEEFKKVIEEHPETCKRPKFYIGDSKDTPPEKSLWVVEVPRAYNTLELKRLPKEELKNPPPDKCDPKKNTCPPYAVGDEVTITGTFKLSSQHSERNSDGLLVYKMMKNVTQNWESPPPPETPPGGAATPPAGGRPSPEDLVHGRHG